MASLFQLEIFTRQKEPSTIILIFLQERLRITIEQNWHNFWLIKRLVTKYMMLTNMQLLLRKMQKLLHTHILFQLKMLVIRKQKNLKFMQNMWIVILMLAMFQVSLKRLRLSFVKQNMFVFQLKKNQNISEKWLVSQLV